MHRECLKTGEQVGIKKNPPLAHFHNELRNENNYKREQAATCPLLFSRLSPVILFAQHLAIFSYGFSSFMPRLYMISLHLFKRKVLTALYANTLLPLICLTLHFVGKS